VRRAGVELIAVFVDLLLRVGEKPLLLFLWQIPRCAVRTNDTFTPARCQPSEIVAGLRAVVATLVFFGGSFGLLAGDFLPCLALV